MKQKYINKSGFTLIELSIVMVIIGLIVGGVFVGQDLIRAAEIRSTISQIEKYDASFMTFFGKYGEIPGDIPSQNAANYGFAARSGATAHGDGNRIITGCDSAGVAFDTKFGCEVALVWRDLSDAGLIAGRFIGTDQCCDNNGALTAPHTMNDFVPAAKIAKGVNINIWGVPSTTIEIGRIKNSSHYYQFFNNFSALGDYTGAYITPIDASNIDKKIDDGLPLTGKVFSQWFNILDYCDYNCLQNQTVTAKACTSNITNTPISTYNTRTVTDNACLIEIKAGF